MKIEVAKIKSNQMELKAVIFDERNFCRNLKFVKILDWDCRKYLQYCHYQW